MFRFISPKLYFLPLWAWEIMPIIVATILSTSVSYGAELQQRSLTIANDTPSSITNYNLGFTLANNETLGSIEVQFCYNSPLVSLNCIAPNGIDVTAASLVSQVGTNGFTIANNSSTNSLVLTRNPSIESAGPITFNFANVTNPSQSGTFYARVQTFASSDASGSATDIGGLALSITNGYTVSATVTPYLLFCVGVSIVNLNCSQASGSYINFGYLTTGLTSSAQSQLLVATNAPNGYTIQLSGNTLTSGNNIVPPLISASTAIPGQNQFGLNLVANSQPSIGFNETGPGTGSPTYGYSQPNTFKFANGDVIASSQQASDYREYTISYIINISHSQPAGVYATTLTYIGIGNF